MKKTILFSLFVAAATFSSWMPANKTATVSKISFDQYLLLPVTPFASYGSFSYTATASPSPTATLNWTTTAETNVVKFKVYRLHIATSQLVIDYVNAKTTGFPRSYSYVDNDVSAGSTFQYSVCAISSDQTQASCSQTTEVNVPNIGR